MGFRIKDRRTGSVIVGLPTPALIENGGGEAYQRDAGIWRLRDDKFDPEGQVYTPVIVEHTEDWTVDVHIKPGDGAEFTAYDDWFVVEAATEAEARQLGKEAAFNDAMDREDPETFADVTVVRAFRGGVADALASGRR